MQCNTNYTNEEKNFHYINLKVLKVTKHWDQVAEGMNYKKKEFILIFSRKFSNESSWKKWVKSFPFQLSELSRTG